MNTFLLRSGELIPMRFAIPVTSIDPMRKFFLRLASRAIKYYQVVVKLSLEQLTSKDNREYSRVVPSLIGMLSNEYIEKVQRFRTGLLETLEATRIEDSVFSGDGSDPGEEGVSL